MFAFPKLGVRTNFFSSQLKKPTIRTESKSLYYQAPPALEEQTRSNLTKKIKDLVANGDEVAVADPSFSIDFKFRLLYA